MRKLTAGITVALVLLSGGGTFSRGEEKDRQRPRIVAQIGHDETVTTARLSPDGTKAITVGEDRAAILWDVATGREIRRFVGHTDDVYPMATTPDFRWLLTGDEKSNVILWNVTTGARVRSLSAEGELWYLAIAPDAGRFLTATSRGLKVWNVADGREVWKLVGRDTRIFSAEFSPDGRWLLTSDAGGPARLRDARTWREVREFAAGTGGVLLVLFAPDGRRVLTGSEDGGFRLWETDTGREILRLKDVRRPGPASFSGDGRYLVMGDDDEPSCMWDTRTGELVRRFPEWSMFGSLSPDGRHVLFSCTPDAQLSATLWDMETGKVVRRLEGQIDPVGAAHLSADGARLFTASESLQIHQWDLVSGREVRRFGGTGEVYYRSTPLAVSPDGRRAATGGKDGRIHLWDADSGLETGGLTGNPGDVLSLAFSPDSRLLLAGCGKKTAVLWDASTGERLARLEGHEGGVEAVAFSPEGRRALTVARCVRVWEVSTGRAALRLDWKYHVPQSAGFSRDGRRVFAGSRDGNLRIWDARTGAVMRDIDGGGDEALSISESPDGRWLAAGNEEGTVHLFDWEAGVEARVFERHESEVRSVSFTPDGRFLIAASQDRTTRVWEVASGRELCRMLSFRDGTWAVLDPQGRFDASNGGEIEWLHWIIDDVFVSLDQLKERYYEPGLLAKHLGLNPEPLREVGALESPDLHPRVRLEAPKGGSSRLRVHLANRGGGIGRVVVKVNGKERTADARGPGVDPDAEELSLTIDLAGDPRLMPGLRNEIEVSAFNREGYLRSRGLRIGYTPPGEAGTAPPRLWGIVSGVSDYRGEKIDLRFAAKDAEDFARALRVAGSRLFGKERLELTVLTTDRRESGERPTRKNILAALENAKRSEPGDLLILYLAGHGVNSPGPEGDYHYLTCDALSADLTDPAVRGERTLSSDEITEQLKAVPALKQVLILDTCAAGGLVQRLTEKRSVPSSQLRALERLKDRTGVHVLAGCAADRQSYEATRYGQGLLTHSLLMGMRGAALREGEFVDVSTLFGFAADRVPDLARNLGGIQRPIVAVPRGGASFDIGRVTDEDRAEIPLRSERPVFLRSAFQDEVRIRDTLSLGRLVDARLREISNRRGDVPLVFLDTDSYPNAHSIAGRYQSEGGRVTVTVVLDRGGEHLGTFPVTGDAAKPEDLAASIVSAVLERLER